MKFLKAINNNVVSALDDNGQEIVVMGKGIGFRAKEGNGIDPKLIEKVFRMENQAETNRLKSLLSSMPMEHIQVSNAIISYANQCLGNRFNQNIYITLTDHINFALYRQEQGMLFQNVLLTEVRRFYTKEYEIGEYALALIEQKLGVHLPLDEAASIALHLVNAEYDVSMSESVHTTHLIQEVLQMVEAYFGVELDEEQLYYDRFVTHLKFFAQRILRVKPLPTQDPQLNSMIVKLYPKEAQCASRIAEALQSQYHYSVSEEEISFLTLHIKRVLTPEV